MGGVQFRTLNDITKNIWRWCEKKNIWIFASYTASVENVEADFKSRRKESTAEIELSSVAFIKITDRLGKPEIDLFVSRVNAKCEKGRFHPELKKKTLFLCVPPMFNHFKNLAKDKGGTR